MNNIYFQFHSRNGKIEIDPEFLAVDSIETEFLQLYEMNTDGLMFALHLG